MKKVEKTRGLSHLFHHYWKSRLVYMDITEHDSEMYFKVVNRKGLTNVYLLEANDEAEKINDRIREIYSKISESNVYYNSSSFVDIIRISQDLTKTSCVQRSVPVGLYREDSFFRGIFVRVSSTSDYKKDCTYISVMPNGQKFDRYYDFEKYEKMREIAKTYNDSNIYYLLDEEVIIKDYKEAVRALKNGRKVEISEEISWDIQEFDNFYYHEFELKDKEEYMLTYDNEIIENESAVYCEDVENYVHCDRAFELRNEGIYYADDIDLVYSFLEDTYIHSDDVVYVVDTQGHEQPVHRDNLDSYYYDEEENIYYTEEHFHHNIIQDYRKTELPPVSSGEKDYFLGIELEIEKEGSTINERSNDILEILHESGEDFSNLLEWKKDSSLTCGVEMVTAPISLELFKEKIIPVVEKLREYGFTSEKGSRCGNHIHISKNVFSEEAQARLVLIYAKFESIIKTLSRRGNNNSYCKDVLENFDSLEIENSMQIVNSQKNKSKCTAVNFSNKNTIEFRVFRGTMNTNVLIANIQLVQLLADWSRKNLTVYDILNLSVADFKNAILSNNYTELLNYCEKKEVI